MMKSWGGEPDEEFDQDLAAGFIGKYLLVGITTKAANGVIHSHEQLHGTIESITAHGIDIALCGIHSGKTWRMPPCLNELIPAQPGKYNLKSTGKIVENPDFTFSVSIRKPVQQ